MVEMESKNRKARNWLLRIEELLADPATRKTAFKTVELESEICAETLRRAYNRKFGKLETNLKFTHDEEALLCAACCTMSRTKDPLNIQKLQDLAKIVFKVDVGKTWAAGFLERHKGVLAHHDARILSPKRSVNNLLDQIEVFISQWSLLLEKHFIDDDNLFVFDETRIGMPEKRGMVIDWAEISAHKEVPRDEAFATLIPHSLSSIHI